MDFRPSLPHTVDPATISPRRALGLTGKFFSAYMRASSSKGSFSSREGAMNNPEFNEPDLVFSKDGEIMVNHDSFLDGTTNSASSPLANKTAVKHFWAEDMFENKSALW